MRALALLCLIACDGGEPLRPDAGYDAGRPVVDAGADAGPPADTWTNFGEEFFATYCVECHDAAPRDFRSIDDVIANGDTVRCGVSDVTLDDCDGWPPARQFPIGDGPFPSDEERARAAAWIEAGAPE
jgi:hypothetical protein